MASLGHPYILQAHSKSKSFILGGAVAKADAKIQAVLHEMDHSRHSDSATFELMRINLATRANNSALGMQRSISSSVDS